MFRPALTLSDYPPTRSNISPPITDVLEHTVSAARGATVGALSGSREVLTELQGLVTEVMKGTIQATGGVGAELGSTAKGSVIGIIRGVGEVATVTVGVCSDTVRAAIKGTSKVGGDVATVARGAVEGTLEATKSIGLRAEDTAFEVTRGAI